MLAKNNVRSVDGRAPAIPTNDRLTRSSKVGGSSDELPISLHGNPMPADYVDESLVSREFERKMKKALALLDRTGIPRRNYLPPTSAFFWRMKLRIPPPHFMPFFQVTLLMGLPFGVIWIGLCMASIGNQEVDLITAVLVFVAITSLIGAFFATYYRLGKAHHRLPDWKDL